VNSEHWGPADGSGPRALLVHGITSSAATMWELGTGLADAGWSVTAVDLPGHGGSGPAPSYAFADVADALHAEFGGGYDLYVGHSLGGAVGTVLLARHPDVARRAVLIDPALLASDSRLAQIPTDLEADKALGVAEVAAANPRWHPRTVEARVEATRAADVEAVRCWLTDNSPWDVTAAAARVRVPVSVLVASADSALAPALAEQLPAANPHWSFETIPDTTHSVHRDDPAAVLERLLAPR
jgi:pimeloyl-ACP methyl ester carboxylesterase